MLPKVILVTCVFACVVRVKCSHNASMSNSVGALYALLSLTEDICGYVNWCSIKSVPSSINRLNTIREGCCKSCSCKQDCFMYNTCCPDLKLAEYFNGSVSSNVTTFIDVLQNSAIVSDASRLVTQKTEKGGGDKNAAECVYSQMLNIDRYQPKGSMYLMVTTCSNVTTNPDLISKCESTSLGTTYMKTLDFVPVQSLSSGIVYRNKYCHQCSAESQAPLAFWDIWIADYGNLRNILTNVVTSLKEFIANKAILFEPSEGLKRLHAPVPCQVVNVGSCPNEGSIYNADGAAACQLYTMPVYAPINGVPKAFRNLACLPCNSIDILRGGCSLFYRWEAFQPLTGKLDITEDKTFDSDESSNLSVERLATSFSPKCQQGFIYDSKLVLCRQIYCPCGMVIHNFTCVPIFREIEGTYEVYVTISSPVIHRNDFEIALLKYLELAIVSSHQFSVLHIALYRSVSTKNQDYAASITFSGRYTGATFIEIMSLAARSFLGSQNITIGNRAEVVNMSVTSSLELSSELADISTGKIYRYSMSVPPTAPKSTKFPLVISECNFCYRIEIMPSEMHPEGRIAYIKRTNTVIHAKLFQRIASNTSRYILCTEQVLGKMDHAKFEYPKSWADADGEKNRPDDVIVDDRFVIKMLTVVAVISVILFVTCVVEVARNKSQSSESTEVNQTELVTISP